ncbi:hypothetical protein L6R52_34700, partial [Myxococcota bacterium]|nr:hypothetical protein [Myxococcota bacterium]
EDRSPGVALAIYALLWLGVTALLGHQRHRVLADGDRVVVTEPLMYRVIGRRDRVLTPHARQRTELRARSVPTRRGTVWYWDVWLGGPGREELVATQAGQLQMRRLAEVIARELRLGFLDTSGKLRGSKPVELGHDELDLPLAERVRRHPALQSKGTVEPAPAELRDERAGATRTISWRLLHGGIVVAVAVVALVPPLFYLVPYRRSPSLVDVYGWDGFFTTVGWTVGLAGALLGVLALWGRRVVLTADHVCVEWTLLGRALPAEKLPREKIERVTIGPDGKIALVTDDHLVTFRTGWATRHDEWVAQTIERSLIEAR